MYFLIAIVGLVVLFQVPPVVAHGVSWGSGAVLIGYVVACLLLRGWIHARRSAAPRHRLQEAVARYQEQYGVTDFLTNFGIGVGKGYTEAAAEAGDLGGVLVGIGISAVASLVDTSLKDPEQVAREAEIRRLAAEVDVLNNQLSGFRKWFCFVAACMVGWWGLVRAKPTSPPPAVVTAPSTPASAAVPLAVLGQWSGAGGDEFETSALGDKIVLVAKKASPSSPFRVGETVATLSATVDAGVFEVETRVRPSLPLGVKLDAAASARCQELWTEVRGKRLTARLDGDRLEIETAKLAIEAAGFEIANGRVTGCKKFSDAKAARVPLPLTRK